MDDPSEAFLLGASWIVSTALVFAIIVGDERTMSRVRLERAWPPASRDAAIVMFGPIALCFHFARTLGSLRSARGAGFALLGLGLGVVAVLFVAWTTDLVVGALASACGVDVEP